MITEDEKIRMAAEYEQIKIDAQTGPVVTAMLRWLEGAPIPPIAQQYAQFGEKYRNHLRQAWQTDLRTYTGDRVTDSFLSIHTERDVFIQKYGFAVPSGEAMAVLANHAPILEIGAGSGAWAKLMHDRGIDVIATDPNLTGFRFRNGRWHPVLPYQGKTAVRRWPDRNVFCSWPSLHETWLRQAARAMRPGRYLIVVREDATADERTWDYVERAFKFHGHFELLNWYFLHDQLEVWNKRGKSLLVKEDDDEDR